MTVRRLDMTTNENERSGELQQIVNLLKSTIQSDLLTSESAIQTAQSIFSALDQTVGEEIKILPFQLPVNRYFDTALDNIFALESLESNVIVAIRLSIFKLISFMLLSFQNYCRTLTPAYT